MVAMLKKLIAYHSFFMRVCHSFHFTRVRVAALLLLYLGSSNILMKNGYTLWYEPTLNTPHSTYSDKRIYMYVCVLSPTATISTVTRRQRRLCACPSPWTGRSEICWGSCPEKRACDCRASWSLRRLHNWATQDRINTGGYKKTGGVICTEG